MSTPGSTAAEAGASATTMWLVFDGAQPLALAAETVLAIEPDGPSDALELWSLLGLDRPSDEPARLARICVDGQALTLRVHARPRLVELPRAVVLDLPDFLRREGASRLVTAVALPPQGPPLWILDRPALLRERSAQPGVPT